MCEREKIPWLQTRGASMSAEVFQVNSLSGWLGWQNKYSRKFCASGYHSSRVGSLVTGKALI